MSKRKSKVISVLIACMLILNQANNWGYNPLDIHVSAADTTWTTEKVAKEIFGYSDCALYGRLCVYNCYEMPSFL